MKFLSIRTPVYPSSKRPEIACLTVSEACEAIFRVILKPSTSSLWNGLDKPISIKRVSSSSRSCSACCSEKPRRSKPFLPPACLTKSPRSETFGPRHRGHEHSHPTNVRCDERPSESSAQRGTFSMHKGEKKGSMTPAMAAGVTDAPWTLAESLDAAST